MIHILFSTSIVKLSVSAVPCTIYNTGTNSTMLGIDNCRSIDTISHINIAKIDRPLVIRAGWAKYLNYKLMRYIF